MKNLLVSIGFLSLMTACSFAYVEAEQTADIDVLRSQGFSESALQIVDLARYNQEGTKGKYQRRFLPVKDGAYTKTKVYIDPTQDDGQFGEHQINFSNTWLGNSTNYSSVREDTGRKASRRIENL